MPDPVQLSLGFTNRPHLVPIDEATVYDVPTKMVELASRVKFGEIGHHVTDAVICLKWRDVKGSFHICGYHYGLGNTDTAVLMLEKVKVHILTGAS